MRVSLDIHLIIYAWGSLMSFGNSLLLIAAVNLKAFLAILV